MQSTTATANVTFAMAVIYTVFGADVFAGEKGSFSCAAIEPSVLPVIRPEWQELGG